MPAISTNTAHGLDWVTLTLSARIAAAVTEELHAGLVGMEQVIDPDLFLRDLIKRQVRSSAACLDADIGLIHARTVAVGRFVLAVGRSVKGVTFDYAHPSVRLVFLIGAPADEVQEYLQRTAWLVRLLRRPGVKDSLLNAANSDAFCHAWTSALAVDVPPGKGP